MIKISKDGFMPVSNSSQQGLEGCFQMGRNARLPVLIRCFSLVTLAFLPDVEEALLQPIGGFQVREVFRPGFQDQPLGLVEIDKAMQENVPVVHQALALCIRERRSDRFAYRFKTLVRHLDHMKVVDNHLGVWQNELRGFKIGTPHIHTNQGDVLPTGQTVQITDNSGLVPVPQEIDDATVADITNDAAGFVQQVNFINAESGAHGGVICLCVFGGLGKDTANGSFIDSHIISNAGKRAFERLTSEIQHQAFGHRVALIHVIERFKECSITGAASITFSDNQDTSVLASDGDVQEQLVFDFVAVQMGVSAMKAAQNNRRRFGGNLVTVCALFYAQNAPVCPSQNIQRCSPMVQIVEKAFFLVWINPVKEGEEGERLPCHSTRYADFWTVFTVGLFHAICRIAFYHTWLHHQK